MALYANGKKYVVTHAKSVNTSDFATKEELNTKQDVISDLSEIRSGASKGATAVQPDELSEVMGMFATKSYVDGLVGDIETILHNINSGVVV